MDGRLLLYAQGFFHIADGLVLFFLEVADVAEKIGRIGIVHVRGLGAFQEGARRLELSVPDELGSEGDEGRGIVGILLQAKHEPANLALRHGVFLGRSGLRVAVLHEGGLSETGVERHGQHGEDAGEETDNEAFSASIGHVRSRVYPRSRPLPASIRIAADAAVSTADIRQGFILYRHSAAKVQQRKRRSKRHHSQS